ncbi:MAG TPA: sulfate adenylyltransferase, partial [Cytophagales bacterium]|nr:sulfate adenylyltransferase [Cytophagales bacterium]
LVVCVNKMDLVGYSEEVFNKIHEDFKNFAAKLNIKDVQFIPISALNGDNIVDKSENMPWYKGRCLLDHLEEVHIESDENLRDARFPVQYVIRPQTTEYHDYRGYAGKITSGIYKKGEVVVVLPSGFKSRIKSIDTFEGEVDEAFAPMSVTLNLEDDIDISRGDMIVKTENQPTVSQDIEAHLCWMDTKSLNVGDKYLVQHNSRKVKCIVKEIPYKINVNTLEKIEQEGSVSLNDICKVVLRTASPVCFDDYQKNRSNGAFILINENTNTTVGACMVTSAVI